MILVLPWPPSANNRLAPVRGRLIASREYREWKELAAVEILAQRVKQGQIPLPPPYEVRLDVRMPDNRRRDLDNLLKVALDAIVRAGIIEDDSLVNRLDVWRDQPKHGGELRLTVRTMK